MKWTFDRRLFILATGLVLVMASCSKEPAAPGPSAGGVIRPADVALLGMQLRPGESTTSFTLVGRVKNRSSQATLTEVQLKMTMEDVLASGATTTVGETTVVLRKEVPPSESRDVEEKVSFGKLPKPKGRHEWNSSVVAVKGK